MHRRDFVRLGAAAGVSALAPALPFQGEKSKLKITGVRLVRTRPAKPLPRYKPSAGSWSTQGVEVASPMSVFPEYKASRSLYMADKPAMGGFMVEISTDKGVKGYGQGGPAGGVVVENHFTKLLMNEDPFNVERIWDILWRGSMHYGRMGIAINAISGVDLALWDLIGKALDVPVYKLLGGKIRDRLPAYCTGNDLEQHIEFGFKMLKLAVPHGPADGREGLKKNVELVKRTRELLGPDGEILLDCWMALTERYTIDLAEAIAPYRVYWMEECLQPHDYEGFGRLNAAIKSTRIVTGEHEYTRYGFRQLLAHNAAAIWQPDIHWCGGMTEIRRIGALAAAYDIPVIPHGGGIGNDCIHFIMSIPNAQWVEMFIPPPGGPPDVYKQFAEEHFVSRGPEGIYRGVGDKPGFGHDIVVES